MDVCKGGLIGKQTDRRHCGDAVQQCSRLSKRGKGSQVPGCGERKKMRADRNFMRVPCRTPKHNELDQERQQLEERHLEITRQQQALSVTAQTVGNHVADMAVAVFTPMPHPKRILTNKKPCSAVSSFGLTMRSIVGIYFGIVRT